MAGPALPTGTVTFLFTDVEGSTRLWEEHPDAMRPALAEHDELIRGAVEAHGGHVVKTTGDGVHAAFATADDGVCAAIDAQRALVAHGWGETGELQVRMGLHTGAAEVRDGDYYGSSLNRAARLMSVGHGGQVLLSGVTADLVRDGLPAGVELRDLGEHTLRDLGRPERVHQLEHPDLARNFPRLRTLDAFPTNLPLQVNSFIGREAELARVVAALTDHRVVTLTGVGGIGKTRLALHAAAEALPSYPDGAWLCELAGVRDADAVVPAVAATLGVTERPGMSLDESLISFLRTQRLLLVLDNCEHLLDGAASLADTIEHSCSDVVVLATSREPLTIDGERVLGVRSLATPEQDAAFEEAVRADTVRLFVERAQAARDDFQVSETNLPAVAEICDRLDGVPLAIELAAARVTTMSPTELARRLHQRFELLSGGRRRAVERHQTLRAAIDWSYDLLGEPERRLLARMSVFNGGCTLESVEAVCGGDPTSSAEVFEVLASLVSRSLVSVDDAGAETRYRLLETIRQYAEERLADFGETLVLGHRHAEHYTEIAERAHRHRLGPEELEWEDRLADERDNVAAAMAFALDVADVDVALRLACALPRFEVGSVSVDAVPVLALAGARDQPRSAVAMLSAAADANGHGDPQQAFALCDEALAIARRLGVPEGTHLPAWVSHVRGVTCVGHGMLDEASAPLLEGVARAHADGAEGLAALFLSFTAATFVWADPEVAVERAQEGLALARHAGSQVALATNRDALALALSVVDPDQARALLAQRGGSSGHSSLRTATLQYRMYAFARLGEWPLVLREGLAELEGILREGEMVPSAGAGVLNTVARGLAEGDPEAAAVLQGAAATLVRRVVAEAAPDRIDHFDPSPAPDPLVSFVVSVRREATPLIVARIGESRLRELRAEGSAMTADEAYAYARRRVVAHLEALDDRHLG
jgi:predicted ATPase/class 3 adenylate cyclase